MRKFLLIGGAVFFALLIVRAPAGLLRLAVPDQGPITLVHLRGTLWDGRGALLVEGVSIGDLAWELTPGTLLQGALGYELALSADNAEISGTIAARPADVDLALSGSIEASFLNEWLARYDIFLAGTFTLEAVRLQATDRHLTNAAGVVRWTGGPVRYILSGTLSNASLPAMNAVLGPGPTATVYPERGQIPVLTAEMLQNGFARVGMTKHLTRLLGNPWPGSDPDHTVVLEVEQQLF